MSVLAVVLLALLTSAQDDSPLISVSFGPEEIWQPTVDALVALQHCDGQTFACVQQVMLDNAASPDAVAFFHLTHWFLGDIQDTGGPVQIGAIFTPWRANENRQTALLGGTPAVVYLEQEVPMLAAERSAEFLAIKADHPDAMFWGSSPAFDSIDTSPQNGQRFIFRFRVLDGCHACAILGYLAVAFDFAPDGTYEAAKVL